MNCIKLKKLFILSLCVAVAIVIPSCKKDSMLRIGFLSNLTHSQALCMCLDETFFEDYNADMYAFNAGPAIIEAMRAKQINIGYVGPVPAISGYESSGGNIKIIAGVTSAGSVLVTRSDIHITSVKELSGMTVAVPQFGNTQDIILRKLIADEGLLSVENSGTVEIIQQDNANIKNLLLKGDIDAALVPEPWGTRLIEEANANVLLDYDEIMGGDYPVTVLAVRGDYLEEHREDVKLFLKAHINMTNAIKSDVSGAEDMVNSALLKITGVKIEDDILNKSFARMNIDYNINAETVSAFVEMCVEQGVIKDKIDIGCLLDTSLLEEVLFEMGIN